MTEPVATRWRSWTAIAAAYVVVLQVLFTGLAAGAFANALSLDRSLAATLCLPGDDGPAGDADAGKSHAGLSCCTAGCPMSMAYGPPLATGGIVDRVVAGSGSVSSQADGLSPSYARRTPYGPRAPPAIG